jgi:integrase
MLIHRASGRPSRAASLYEVHLDQSCGSPNTGKSELWLLAHLYTWAEEANVALEQRLLTGEGLSISQVRAFSAYLRRRWDSGSAALAPSARLAHNKILRACTAMCVWCVEHYARSSANGIRRAVEVQLAVDSQRNAWKSAALKVRRSRVAPDLTESEISVIEDFLKPENRSRAVGIAQATRDYLMWRMAMEFGMRAGEILAMRTVDCPSRENQYFRIVRIEERGSDYFDPRAPYAPRPKTLSRDLGSPVSNTVFPRLVAEYRSQFRYSLINRSGRAVKRFVLPHDFLIVSHRGDPLSISAMQDVATSIARALEIPFHWHLVRHAFFNRAYAAVASIADHLERQVRLEDLVYWGGWRDSGSLNIYTLRERRDRARRTLRFWHTGHNEWPSLI